MSFGCSPSALFALMRMFNSPSAVTKTSCYELAQFIPGHSMGFNSWLGVEFSLFPRLRVNGCLDTAQTARLRSAELSVGSPSVEGKTQTRQRVSVRFCFSQVSRLRSNDGGMYAVLRTE